MMRKIATKYRFIFIALIFSVMPLTAQRQMENLDRGLVAVKTDDGVFTSWRIQGYEWEGVTYNIYRDGTKINGEPLQVSNFKDESGTLESEYSVSAIINGIEQEISPVVLPLSNQYLEIPLVSRPAGYEPNDATVADLDGDGEYEIIVKRIIHDWTAEATQFAYFEAYKMDGTLMWEINVGPNIMSSSAVEINIAAFDLDEDGKAEVFLRTSEGTIFGDSTVIGDTDGDNITNYRYSVLQSPNMEYMCAGPEFLSLIDGETGVELDRIDFIPRISAEWWGDGYGHRANKFFFGAPYLDGKKPSIFIGRGIYTKTIMRTYDVVDKKMVARWEFRATDTGDPYYGQGNHNMTIADVDGDGRDEIAWGSMTVDDDGTGLYSTELGHGDAIHVGDLDPFRKGTEIWKCLEESPNYGTAFYDGATGEMLIHDILGRDCGRACAANISNNIKGATLWGSTTVFSATTKDPVNPAINSTNFRIYWDGDLLEELLDHNWNGSGGEGVIQKSGYGNIFTATGTNSCNWTKGTPTLQADLFGDWREEVIWRTTDNSKIRIYTTVDPTAYRNYTLMHDHQYRQAICWQMCGYNQPPHVSYFLGKTENILLPPPPTITNQRMVYQGTGIWDKTSNIWLMDGQSSVYDDGNHILFDVSMGNDVSVSLADSVAPSVMTVNSPGNYTLNVTNGKISGSAKVVKQGMGEFIFNGEHDYTGKTEIWSGRMNFSGTILNSPVWVNLFAELAADGSLAKGLSMRFGSVLAVGSNQVSGSLRIGDSLNLENNATIVLDLFSPASDQNDSLIVNGDLIAEGNTIIQIVPHLAEGETLLEPGNYTLITVGDSIKGDIANFSIEGILGTSYELNVVDGNIVITINEMRGGTSVIWSGEESDSWDLAKSLNFLNNGNTDIFATGDTVIFNDDAILKTVNISEIVNPGSVNVDSESDYTFNGSGSISGDATSLSKTGSGKLLIQNNNSFKGKLTIKNGTLEINEMPSLIENISPIGPASDNPSLLEINGGTLSILNACDADRAAFVGSNGATLSVAQKVNWNSVISGGQLAKTGSGEVAFAAANTNNSIIVQEGIVSLFNEEARAGNTVIFEGGTFKSYDNTYSYSYDNTAFNVPEGKTGTLYLDGRCTYAGGLTGAGTLNIYTPWIRSDLQGNWSSFMGTINVITDADGGTFILGNSAGYKNSAINLNSGVTCIYQHSENATIEIGELKGVSGSYLGAGGQASNIITWKIGGKNTDASFGGQINNVQYKNSGAQAAIIKTGTGKWILNNSNLYSGGTIIEEGSLIVQNMFGSATGTGNVTVKSNALLGGVGIISGSIIVESNGSLAPGYLDYINDINIEGNLTLNDGAYLVAKIDSNSNNSDFITVSGSTSSLGVIAKLVRKDDYFEAGEQFKLIDCASISGTVSGIIPESPGEGLEWDLSEFNSNGLIKVVQTPVNNINNINSEKLNIYPNPSTGKVYFNLPPNEGECIVKIENMNGTMLSVEDYPAESQIEMDLSSFGTGIYIISIDLNGNIIRKKCVIK